MYTYLFTNLIVLIYVCMHVCTVQKTTLKVSSKFIEYILLHNLTEPLLLLITPTKYNINVNAQVCVCGQIKIFAQLAKLFCEVLFIAFKCTYLADKIKQRIQRHKQSSYWQFRFVVALNYYYSCTHVRIMHACVSSLSKKCYLLHTRVK